MDLPDSLRASWLERLSDAPEPRDNPQEVRVAFDPSSDLAVVEFADSDRVAISSLDPDVSVHFSQVELGQVIAVTIRSPGFGRSERWLSEVESIVGKTALSCIRELAGARVARSLSPVAVDESELEMLRLVSWPALALNRGVAPQKDSPFSLDRVRDLRNLVRSRADAWRPRFEFTLKPLFAFRSAGVGALGAPETRRLPAVTAALLGIEPEVELQHLDGERVRVTVTQSAGESGRLTLRAVSPSDAGVLDRDEVRPGRWSVELRGGPRDEIKLEAESGIQPSELRGR